MSSMALGSDRGWKLKRAGLQWVDSKWYHSAMQQKAGRIVAAGVTKEVGIEPVQGDINNAIDEVYKKKYNNRPYLSPMISARARAATVTIIPVLLRQRD